MTKLKKFESTVKMIGLYKPNKTYRMPDNPPKRELERKFKLQNNKIIEVTD